MMSRILYQSDAACVEFFSANHAKLAWVFSPLLQSSLSSNPEEGAYLLQCGFDVVVFKIKSPDWVAVAPPGLLKALANLAARRHYAQTVAWGSAQGAYDAMALSGVLQPGRAMLVSPQYRGEVRLEAGVSPDCEFFIFLDNKSADQQHLEKMLESIPDGHARVVKLPYAGTPVSTCLMEMGLLAQLELKVLEQGSCAGLDFSGRAKGRSVAYLFNLGTALLSRNKLRSALGVTQKALDIHPGIWSLHYRKAQILARLGRHEEAIPAFQAALALEQKVPDLHYHLGLSFLALERMPEALQASDKVIELVTDNHAFWGFHSILLWRNGRVEDSLNTMLRALELDPGNAGYHAHKSAMLLELERFDEALQEANDAVALAPDNPAFATYLKAVHVKKQQSLPPPQQFVSLEKLLAPWR